MAKEGSTVSGLMDTLATSVSLALQYGVPLKDVVNKFAHVRFEPSGFTGNPEIPIAKSIVDYIFRWLGSRFLPSEEKAALGLIDRSQVVDEIPADAPVGGLPASSAASLDMPPAEPEVEASGLSRSASASPAPTRTDDTPSATVETAVAEQVPDPAPSHKDELVVIASNGNGHSNGNGRTLESFAGSSLGGGVKVAFAAQADAPSCADCGSIMVRNGSCYKCLNCGSTSGCS